MYFKLYQKKFWALVKKTNRIKRFINFFQNNLEQSEFIAIKFTAIRSFFLRVKFEIESEV